MNGFQDVARDPSAWQRATIVLLIAVVYLLLPNSYPRFISPNELSRILLTKAIVEERSVTLDRGVARIGEFSDLARHEGHYFSDKAPGLSLLAVPVYGAWRRATGKTLNELDAVYLCKLVTVTIPAILFAVFLAVAWKRFPAGGGIGLVGLFLGTTMMPQSLSFTGHVPMTILCFAASVLITSSNPTTLGRATLAGLLAGLALLVDLSSAIFCVIAIVAMKRVKPALIFITACGVVASVWFLYNYLCFHDPFEFAYHHMIRPRDLSNRAGALFGARAPQLEALWGLTFSPIRGILIHSPFALAWVVMAHRTCRRPSTWRDDIFLLAVPPAYLLATSCLPDWQGGWSLGCRYLTPAMPFLAMALARLFEEAKGRLWLVAATTWAVLLHILTLATWSLPPFEGFRFPALELSSFLARHGAFAPTLLLALEIPAIATAALILFLGIAAIVVASRPMRVPTALIAMLGAMTLFVTVAAVLTPGVPARNGPVLKQVSWYMGYRWHPNR